MRQRRAAEPPRRSPTRSGGRTIRLAGSIGRSGVEGMARAATEVLADCPPGIVDCDAGSADLPALPTVDVLARIALAARRTRHELRLEHAPPVLMELLELCGLRGVFVVADADAAGGGDAGGT